MGGKVERGGGGGGVAAQDVVVVAPLPETDDDQQVDDKKEKKNKNGPTVAPTISPAPTGWESAEPTIVPTTLSPTGAESEEPTITPTTISPSTGPSVTPSQVPTTAVPSNAPSTTPAPTVSHSPTLAPTISHAPTVSSQPTTTPTIHTVTLDLPEMKFTLERSNNNRRHRFVLVVHHRRLIQDEMVLYAAMQRFLDEFFRGQFGNQYLSVNSTSTLDAGTDVLTTTGTAKFTEAPDNFLDEILTYFEFFGQQELEEDLAEYGVVSVLGIQLNGQQVTPQVQPGEVNDSTKKSANPHRTLYTIVGAVAGTVILCLSVACLAGRGRRMCSLDNNGAGDGTLGAKKVEENDGFIKPGQDERGAIDPVAEAESEDDDADDPASAQYPKPVYIRPYAEKSDDDPSEYTSDGDIVSIGSSQITPKKPFLKMTPLTTSSMITEETTTSPTTIAATTSSSSDMDPASVAKSGKESMRSYQYDPNRLGEVISKTKQVKP